MNDPSHITCERIRMCLTEVGLSPDRMMCDDGGRCGVGFGKGNEGLPLDVVERLCDRAIALANTPRALEAIDESWPQ